MVRRILKTWALGLGLALTAGAASAATSAVVTNDLNIRTGPSAAYQRYGTIPAGDEVTVYGCLRGYNWCDVSWDGERGWVHGAYLAYLGRQYYRQPIPTVAVRIGVPVYGFDPYDYHRRYYTGRSWYHDRYLGSGGYERRDFGRDADRLRRERDRREAFRDGPPPPPPPRYDDYRRGPPPPPRYDDYRRGPPPPPYGGPRDFGRDRGGYDNDRFDPRRRYLDDE